MTVQQLLETVTSAELAEWIAFYRLERETSSEDPGEVAEQQLKKIFGAPKNG